MIVGDPERASDTRSSRTVSTLTQQEQRIVRDADLDLGPGYPSVDLPDWIVQVLTDRDLILDALGLRRGSYATGQHMRWEQRAVSAVRTLLGLPDVVPGFVTFSGSIALDRAIKTALPHGGMLLTTNPSIDIATAMALEDHAVSVCYFDSWPLVPEEFGFERFEAGAAAGARAVLLVSPQNPTGSIIEADRLAEIAEYCAVRGMVLLADQTFCLYTAVDGRRTPLLPDVAPPDLDWLMVWDTGKTFGFREDKLGFIFCSQSLARQVGERLTTVQFGVSARLLAQFSILLSDRRVGDYLEDLCSTVRTNCSLLAQALLGSALRPHVLPGGSLLLIQAEAVAGLKNLGLSDYLLDNHGLGLVGFERFVHGSASQREDVRHFARLALARRPDVIRAAAQRLISAADDLGRAGA